jgi:FkbM family methyltransferase
MWVDPRSTIGQAILVKGEFDPGVWRILDERLAPGSVLLDVGANVGYYTMLAANKVAPHGVVHAFEIDPRPLACLRRNAHDCRHANIRVHELAVGRTVGTGHLQQKPESGHSSVSEAGAGHRVPLTSLDHWLKTHLDIGRIAGIKLDIEGGELAALEGMRALLREHKPFIVCEAWTHTPDGLPGGDADLRAFFGDMGYSVLEAEGVHTPTLIAVAQ